MRDKYDETYMRIFYIILTISIIAFLIITGFTYFITRRVTSQLKNIETIFSRISHKGLFPSLVKGIGAEDLLRDKKGIEQLIDSCIDKVDNISEFEQKFEAYEWGNTRPTDKFIFTRWNEKVHPVNLHTDKQMTWRYILPKLSKHP